MLFSNFAIGGNDGGGGAKPKTVPQSLPTAASDINSFTPPYCRHYHHSFPHAAHMLPPCVGLMVSVTGSLASSVPLIYRPV